MPEELLKIMLLRKLADLLSESPLPVEKKLEVLEDYILALKEHIKD